MGSSEDYVQLINWRTVPADGLDMSASVSGMRCTASARGEEGVLHLLGCAREWCTADPGPPNNAPGIVAVHGSAARRGCGRIRDSKSSGRAALRPGHAKRSQM